MESQDPAEAIAAPEPPVEAAPTGAPEAAPPTPEAAPVAVAAGSPSPSYVFFGVIAAIALIADVVTKAWAEITLSARPARDAALVLVDDVLALSLAYNRGGAWGLLQNASEAIRRPFFLGVSVAAAVFIVSLYDKLQPEQRALRWGLPLVLGGALGNLTDRIVRSSVIDFIDYRADWVTRMNEGIAKVVSGWHVTDHWPTFNVADICICTGVALMAVDMFTSPRPAPEPEAA